ncbi:MAG: hypothetical protein K6C99_06100 [Lachnospiraceae bacterium]|nr:hypothetical protein [Lachnospiraceae bacterium]
MAGSNDLSEKLNTGKDFASEYRKSVEMEIPDLWDRINAGIDAKEKEKEDEKTAESTAEIRKFGSAKKPRRNPAVYVMPAVAAVICIGVMIPLFMNGGMKNAATSQKYEGADCAAEPMDQMAAEETENAVDGSAEIESVESIETDTKSHNKDNSNRSFYSASSDIRSGAAGAESECAGAVDEADPADVDTVSTLGVLTFSRDDGKVEGVQIFSLRKILITVNDGTSEEDIVKLAKDNSESVRYCYKNDEGYLLVLDEAVEEEDLDNFCRDLMRENDFIISAVLYENED